ncbi:MAG: transcription elongation factor GreA [Gemmatimonadetes bacterium]|nr:transcription elongation factor GreA [Gemmatimonadota bacterium]
MEAIKQKLQAEVEALNHELNVTLPATLKTAVQLGDLKENGDYHAARERQVFVQARLSHLRNRLSKLSSIDLTKIPRGCVGLGSRVAVVDQATKEKETYDLVISDAMDFEGGQISVASPIGRALLDRKKGDTVTVQLPAGPRKLKIVELRTFHEQIDE